VIVQAPDPILTTRCRPVTPGDARRIAENLRAAMLWAAMQQRPAAGLAAPQIGEPFRLFVLDGYAHAFVNPRVLKTSADAVVDVEGCLSLPRTTLVRVRRPQWIKLTFVDENGFSKTLKLHGRDARAALHELDHLDGLLITDRAEAVAA
jgi:peptide deformylase